MLNYLQERVPQGSFSLEGPHETFPAIKDAPLVSDLAAWVHWITYVSGCTDTVDLRRQNSNIHENITFIKTPTSIRYVHCILS